MFETRLLTYNKQSKQFDCLAKANMSVPRHGHSACSFANNFIVVTGTRKEVDGSARKCEVYNCKQNEWGLLPQLNQGRHYHASCEFNNEYVYVFCGISNTTRRYMSTVERVNVKHAIQNLNTMWEVIEVRDIGGQPNPIAARQGLGAAQFDGDTIMIMGGFGGKYFSESLNLCVSTNQVTKTNSQLPATVFPFAVPTLSDGEMLEVFTVDWTTYKLFRFKDENWAALTNLRANATYVR